MQGAVPPTSEVYARYSAARRGHGDAADARRSHGPERRYRPNGIVSMMPAPLFCVS